VRLKLIFCLPAALLLHGVLSASNYGDNALFNAVASGDTAVVAQLLDGGADIEQTDASKVSTALIVAIISDNEPMVRFLVGKGANINSTRTLQTPLQNAVTPRMARLLVELGADVNLVHNDNTAFMFSGGTQCDEKMVETYADLGADFSIKNSRILSDCLMGQNMFGTRPQKLEFIKFLVSKGARVREAGTALSRAANSDLDDIVKYLISEGADATNSDALFYASNSSTIKLLLKAGANLESQNPAGMTPLMDAVQYCNTAKVKILLSAGAKTAVIDNQGRSLIQILNAAFPRGEVLESTLKLHKKECAKVRSMLRAKGVK